VILEAKRRYVWAATGLLWALSLPDGKGGKASGLLLAIVVDGGGFGRRFATSSTGYAETGEEEGCAWVWGREMSAFDLAFVLLNKWSSRLLEHIYVVDNLTA